MKIGFFTDLYCSTVWGVEVSMDTFKRQLEAAGHQVFIYAPHFSGSQNNPKIFRFPSIRILKHPEIRLAIPVLPNGFSWKEILEKPLEDLKDFNKFLDFKLDIAHAHTPITIGLLAKYVASRQKIPLVYTHHSDYPICAKIYLKEKLILPFLAKVLPIRYANSTDAVLAPSPKIKNWLRQNGTQKPIYVLPTGINLKIFKKSAAARKTIRKKFNLNPKTKILIFVGRINKEKNVEFLIEALTPILKKRKDVLLLIVGEGQLAPKLKRIALEAGISKNIIFAGRIPHEEIQSYYQTADVFVFPALSETQGIVILEAIACGLPVVALKDDAFEGMIIPDKNGFLVPRNSSKLFAEKAMEILDNPVLYKRFSQTSQKIAKNFSEEKQANKLLAIYEKLIAEKKSPKE